MYELVPAVAEGTATGQMDGCWLEEHAWPVVNVLNSALMRYNK